MWFTDWLFRDTFQRKNGMSRMPDSNGKLTNDEQEAFKIWLKDKAPNFNCHACGRKDFFLFDSLVAPMNFQSGGFVIGSGNTLPMVLMTCNHCGHSASFSAGKVGISIDGRVNGISSID